MNVYKRNGTVVPFDKQKIIIAVNKAAQEIDGQTYPFTAEAIGNYVEGLNRDLSVEEIQDIIEDQLMNCERKDIARAYIRYRYLQEIRRNTTDTAIIELMAGKSDYWNKENSNKDAAVVTTQRDYLAGITSTDIAKRFLLPPDVVAAHNEGIIHEHDMDYMAQNALHNCCLINLEDMLQNGTVINGVQIHKPKRLLTASTIATQIITAVASSQYGGTTISLTHLAPFVRSSYQEYFKKYKNRNLPDDEAQICAEEDIRKEITDSVQTFNYQINSMSTTNGQAPFLSVLMWINEEPEYSKENVMLIEEFLKQRIQGMPNEKGVYITPAFPKLLYMLDEDNITPESPYWWLTELAAKCTAKRMAPDYISAKKMREYKINKNGIGDVYPCINKTCA